MTVKVNLKLPASVWTASDSAALASNTLASIKLRTSKGIDAQGTKFDDYSTNPLSVSLKGARLKPKGGIKSKSGKSVFYQGGYKQYKEESRKRTRGRGVSAEVDLVLSGQLMNNFVVLEAKSTSFKIGLTKHVRHYGYDVNDQREFIGLTPKEVDILVNAVAIDIGNKLRKNR
jgi:hypothetical protein